MRIFTVSNTKLYTEYLHNKATKQNTARTKINEAKNIMKNEMKEMRGEMQSMGLDLQEGKLPVETCRKLIHGYRKCLTAVSLAKGCATKCKVYGVKNFVNGISFYFLI